MRVVQTTRPRFGKIGGRQVRTLRTLRSGRMFIWANQEQGVCGLYKVFDDPYQKEDGSWWVRVVSIDEHGDVRYRKETSLADYSIVPYGVGGWNRSNCFLRTDAKTSEFLERTKREAFQLGN